MILGLFYLYKKKIKFNLISQNIKNLKIEQLPQN